MKSTVALTAQAIRKDLKAAYPQTKFSVRSQNYTGGDSIDVEYTMTLNGPKESDVKALLSKYEDGHFDSMTDMYEYKTGRGELGTKYLFIHCDIEQLAKEHKSDFMAHWQLATDTDQECYTRLRERFHYSLCKYVRNYVLKQA